MNETPKSLERLPIKYRLRKCQEIGCQQYAKQRFLTRTSRGNRGEWLVCSPEHAESLAGDLAMLGLEIR